MNPALSEWPAKVASMPAMAVMRFASGATWFGSIRFFAVEARKRQVQRERAKTGP
jgi:hypothetical protein